MKRIQIDPCWVLEVASHELDQFDLLNENGQEISLYQTTSFHMARRKSDGKVFKSARFGPVVNSAVAGTNLFYLEDL